MKRGLLLLTLLVGLSGCASALVVAAPDGYPALYVRCHGYRMEGCYMKAERLCPPYQFDVGPPLPPTLDLILGLDPEHAPSLQHPVRLGQHDQWGCLDGQANGVRRPQ